MPDEPKTHSELVDDVREALLRIKQRTEGPDPYVNGLYRDAIDALASLEEQVETMRRALDVCAHSNHWKAIELGLSDREFKDCGDPTCVSARNLLDSNPASSPREDV